MSENEHTWLVDPAPTKTSPNRVLYGGFNDRDFLGRVVARLAARGARVGGREIGKTSRMYASRTSQKSLAY
jgi:hypothetical protein